MADASAGPARSWSWSFPTAIVTFAVAVTVMPACAEQSFAAIEASALLDEAAMIGVTNTGLLAPITGPELTAPRWDVYGTDLGHMFWHRDRLYMVFGDTFGEGSRHRGRNWRSNVLARLSAPDLATDVLRIESMVTGADGFARELIPSQKKDGVEKTVIPTNGVSTGQRMFLHYMSVRKWHGAGYWDVGHSGLAYSDDDGETWAVSERAVWPSGVGFEQVAFVRHERHVYSFGIPGGRHGGVRLRRVEEDRVLEPAAYEYWSGSRWVEAPDEARMVVPAPVGELSVAWNVRYRRWMMMYLDPERNAVMLRFSPDLTGPWSAAQVAVSGGEHPGLYAPYIVPVQDIGSDIWFTMSKWGPYNVFLMRMSLVDMSRLAG